MAALMSASCVLLYWTFGRLSMVLLSICVTVCRLLAGTAPISPTREVMATSAGSIEVYILIKPDVEIVGRRAHEHEERQDGGTPF